VGMYGDFIYFLSNLFQSIFLSQGCFLISSKPLAPSRLDGFLTNVYVKDSLLC
jgi:hypothetical protein